ncbi:peptidase, partial [Elysia marginata]
SAVLALLTGSTNRKLIVLFTILFCLGLLLLVILLPISFVYVEYHEYALSRNSWTGTVDYSEVYEGGCYLLAPQDELIWFDATAHFLQQSLEIMDSTGLSIGLDISLQYFLKRGEVPRLFQKHHHGYHKVIHYLVESTIKNTAVGFTLDQYRLHRQEVEARIFSTVRRVLSGDCCDSCCPDNCNKRKVDCSPSVCRPVGICHPGHHVEIKYFQLGAIRIPETVMNRHMKTIVLQVEADRELYYQKRAIEVKKTEQLAQDIRNKAEELRQEARAQDRVIRVKAEAEKLARVEKARQEGLRLVFSMFNITQEETKLSYIYAHALANMGDNLRYSYAYQNLGAYSP